MCCRSLPQGLVDVKGNVAYTAQENWIRNASVKQNILFGLPYDADRYMGAVKAAALLPDLSILPDGDGKSGKERERMGSVGSGASSRHCSAC